MSFCRELIISRKKPSSTLCLLNLSKDRPSQRYLLALELLKGYLIFYYSWHLAPNYGSSILFACPQHLESLLKRSEHKSSITRKVYNHWTLCPLPGNLIMQTGSWWCGGTAALALLIYNLPTLFIYKSGTSTVFLIKPVREKFLEPLQTHEKVGYTAHWFVCTLGRTPRLSDFLSLILCFVACGDNATNEANTATAHPSNWNIVSDLQGPEFYNLSPGHKRSQWRTSTHVAVNSKSVGGQGSLWSPCLSQWWCFPQI